MTAHNWGDGFDFDKLHEIEEEIGDKVKSRTMCTVVSKEKYGTLRFEHVFPPGGAMWVSHDLHREYLDSDIYARWRTMGWKVLVEECLMAAKRYPKYEDEILEDIASHDELVPRELHDKYWKTIK